jgi:hypothetical protein
VTIQKKRFNFARHDRDDDVLLEVASFQGPTNVEIEVQGFVKHMVNFVPQQLSVHGFHRCKK